ncbi:hypothetical protein HJC23_010348 [Cyclotella cryptica]|uniref:HMG box domain-containing protein n=1 Tax=Cyclotella cryptica TaxID=29204 RepID=A0ABD3QPS7_9STRA|eukprot:CCRYP_003763-RA/>CCRYP_003763-RA protein AED:0.18 eAED:0.18 QI:0/-1/0/1/-1/1/1/0/409
MPKMPTMPKMRKTTPTKRNQAKAKRSEYDSLDRPLNHYNLFYMLERELFLQKAGVDKAKDANKRTSGSGIVRFEHYADLASSFPLRPARYRELILPEDWFMHGKKRRTHCRHHGVVTLTEMTSAIASSWKTIDPEVKDFVCTISSMIKQRRDKIRTERDLSERPQSPKPVMSLRVATLSDGVSRKSAGPSNFLQDTWPPVSHQHIDNQQFNDGNSYNSSSWKYERRVGSVEPFHLRGLQSSVFPNNTSSPNRTQMSGYSDPVVLCQYIQDNATPNNVESNPSRSAVKAEMNRLSAEVLATSGFCQQQGFQPGGCGQSRHCRRVATPEETLLTDEAEPLILCQPVQEPVVGVEEASHVLAEQVSMVGSWAQQLFSCDRRPPVTQGTYSQNDLFEDVMSNDEIISLYHSLG